MNVSLSQELEAFILEQVESGMYRSCSEVVREALRLLEHRDRVRTLRKANSGATLLGELNWDHSSSGE